jgi:hypothetical protein
MKLVALAFLAAIAAPALASAQTASIGRTIDAATQLPDTTYRVVVDRVTDATHIAVTFPDGQHTVLTAGRPNMTFASVHSGDTLMLSTSKGTVLVYKDYGVVAAPASTP